MQRLEKSGYFEVVPQRGTIAQCLGATVAQLHVTGAG